MWCHGTHLFGDSRLDDKWSYQVLPTRVEGLNNHCSRFCTNTTISVFAHPFDTFTNWCGRLSYPEGSGCKFNHVMPELRLASYIPWPEGYLTSSSHVKNVNYLNEAWVLFVDLGQLLVGFWSNLVITVRTHTYEVWYNLQYKKVNQASIIQHASKVDKVKVQELLINI